MKKEIRKVLVVNSGSSSLKYQLFDMKTETRLAKGLVERIGCGGPKDHAEALKQVVAELSKNPALTTNNQQPTTLSRSTRSVTAFSTAARSSPTRRS